MTRSRSLGMVLAAAAFTAAGACKGGAQQAQPTPMDSAAQLVRRADSSRILGAKDAPVTVFEVADFECPYCAEFANETFGQIDSAYVRPGKVRWVFLNMPLVIHLNAFQAAEAALCAGAVANQFWGMHRRLYASQREWTRLSDPFPVFLSYARALGVPQAPYQACVRVDRVWPVIMADNNSAVVSHINATPTYIIGQQVVAVGPEGFDKWKTILDKALEAAATRKKPTAPPR